MKTFNHFIVAKITGVSDLGPRRRLEPLWPEYVSHRRQRKELERTEWRNERASVNRENVRGLRRPDVEGGQPT